MPSEYESPRKPLIKKTCFGDSAPNQASKREEKLRKYGYLKRRHAVARCGTD